MICFHNVSPIFNLFMLLLRAIQRAEHSLHRGLLDIRIRGSAKECCARGYLDLDIGYGLRFGSLLKRMLCKGEHLKIGYIALVECLHKSVNTTIATTTQFAPNTVNRDMSCTCYDLCAILRHYVLYMEGFERKRLAAVQIFLFECLEDLLARKFLAAFIGKILDNLAQLNMHRLGQLVAKLGLHHIGHATLT